MRTINVNILTLCVFLFCLVINILLNYVVTGSLNLENALIGTFGGCIIFVVLPTNIGILDLFVIAIIAILFVFNLKKNKCNAYYMLLFAPAIVYWCIMGNLLMIFSNNHQGIDVIKDVFITLMPNLK